MFVAVKDNGGFQMMMIDGKPETFETRREGEIFLKGFEKRHPEEKGKWIIMESAD